VVNGGGLFFCALAPLAMVGMLMMVEVRVELARSCARLLTQSWRHPDSRLEGSAWRAAGLAAANILLPLLASFFGMAALASHLGLGALASGALHGLNVLQAALGLVLMVQVLRRHKPRYILR
jgi:hypothetical protein